ncbi:MAG: hypothetical protein E6J90_10475 [Deltaproteobacteria bacterium]|nr:MAG: hypothetical protein E6J91_29985 [Deltaproteobacteria bacterium]TMQ23469.1 MAG: hypothetical protein E6J90_10475 [Deltaproteobacteria bacterium]
MGSIGVDGAARGRSERAAVLLEVRSDRGAVGLGEAAPLPGMSLDTLAQAQAALATFARLAPFELAACETHHARASGAAPGAHVGASEIRHRSAPRAAESQIPGEAPRSGSFVATPTGSGLLPFEIVDRDAAQLLVTAPPAARFAIETALCDALAHDRGISLAALLSSFVDRAISAADTSALPPGVPLAAVVDDPVAARRAFAAGIRCFKIKLAAGDPLDRVLAIAAAVPAATLRIDANRTWPRAEVAARLAALAQLPIEYVEEPCRDAHLLLNTTPLACKLALDEGLPQLSRDELVTALRSPDLAAVILKPTLLGGLSAAIELAALARQAGVAAIASHGLEGPIGTAACAELALVLGGAPPAGLAPHAALAGWRIQVEQLAADHIRAAAAPGLGFADLDLAAVVKACGTRIPDEAGPS